MTSIPRSPFAQQAFGSHHALDSYGRPPSMPNSQGHTPLPHFTRHPSQSDSDASDHSAHHPLSANSLKVSLDAPNHYSNGNSPRDMDTSGGGGRGTAQGQHEPQPYQAPFSSGGGGGPTHRTSDEDLGGHDGGDPDPNDFTQTFYDPFRIKHRRRTSPPQLKILEYHFDRNPKPDVTLRKALSEQLDMTPREVQVWFQNRRAKTKKLREKLEKEAEGDDARQRSPESTYGSLPRGGPSTSSALPTPGTLHQFNPDYNASRRGSSPAVMSSGMVGSRYDQYYDGPSADPSHSSFNGQPPQPHPFLNPLPSRPLPPSALYASPISLNSGLSSSSSPNDLVGDFHQGPPPGARPPAMEDQAQGGRRFSLPAYGSSYTAAQCHWFPTKEAEDANRFPGAQASFPPSFPPSFPASLYTQGDFQSSSDLDLLSSAGSGPSDFGFGAPRDDGGSVGGDYSPSSSGDDQQAPYDYSYPPSISGPFDSQVQHLNQYTFGRPREDAPGLPQPQDARALFPGSTSPGDLSESPAGAGAGGRRSSCPADFLPYFDNLGLSSPPPATPLWSAAYAPVFNPHQQSLSPPPALQKRHSFAAPYPHPPSSVQGFTSGSAPPHQYVPQPPPTSAGPPGFYPNPQFLQQAGRRGSTSAALGTIAETSNSYAMVDDSAQGQSSERGVARKSRSQASLRGPQPYPPPQDRQDRRSPLLPERRGSIPLPS